MGALQLILIALGLSMDAFAVAVCKGLKMKKVDYKYMLLIASFFGGFQALMPFLGWLLGKNFADLITKYDHFIAFALLAFIGGQMVVESFKKDEVDNSVLSYDIKEIFLLAIATSIDALAIGITFAFLKTDILSATVVIGVITFICSVIGVFIGNKFGIKYKNKAEFAGGLILIIMGLKILLEHLNIL